MINDNVFLRNFPNNLYKEEVVLFKIFSNFLNLLPASLFRAVTSRWAIEGESIPFSSDDLFIIFCHTYCLDKNGQMTVATRNGLLAAARLIRDFPQAIVVFGRCSFPAENGGKEEIIKRNFLVKNGLQKLGILTLNNGVRNTIDEVRGGVELFLKKILPDDARGVVVITEKVCAGSQLLMWKKLLPPSFKIGYHTVQGDWNSDCLYNAQQSPRIWLVVDIVRRIIFHLFGSKAAAIKESVVN